VVLAFGLCVVALVSSICSDIGTNYVGQHIIAALRKQLGEKVLAAPIEQIERYRSHRLIPVLTHDVDTISDFAFAFAPLAISLTVTLGCLGYLAYLSLPMFLLMLVAMGVGSVIQYAARARGIRGFIAARDAEDQLQKHYKAIAEGAKELRIHRPVASACSTTASANRRRHPRHPGALDQHLRDRQEPGLDAVLRGHRPGLALQSLWPANDKR
jgi:putative ATP-binding cassette transporter